MKASLIVWITATKNDPNARDPRWYLNNLYILLETALSTSLSFSLSADLGEKYQRQAALAITNWLQAEMKATPQSPPKTYAQIEAFYYILYSITLYSNPPSA